MLEWLVRLFNFPAEKTSLLALVLGFAFIAILLVTSRNYFCKSWTWAFIMALILMSFPLQSILEKGNIDILVYLLMTFSIVFFVSQSPLFSFNSIPLILLAVSLKIFPVFGFAGVFTSDRSYLRNSFLSLSYASRVAILVGSILGLLLSIPWFPTDSMNAMGDARSYGLRALGYVNTTLINIYGLETARLLIRILIVSKIGSFTISGLIFYRLKLDIVFRRYLSTLKGGFNARFSTFYILLLAWAWLGSYVFVISYNHRHIFMFPAAISLAGLIEDRNRLNSSQYRTVWIVLFLIIYIFYIPFFDNPIFSLLADLSVECYALPIIASLLTVLMISPWIRKVSIA